ncbi:conserved hypothetical protein [methanotrophic bacterial endosymbiont of Bathymodiolus sp.]|nr:conserved hypothetical protein [methanotrophic bacterial endosymbiont of Bathymodiolus sp.]
MGVFPATAVTTSFSMSLPHARGGVSFQKKGRKSAKVSSPRPWGCFLYAARHVPCVIVFPTPVGVFPGCF